MTGETGQASGGVRFPARAKLNLYLHITGRRADGFHLLESLVGFAGVGDAVTAMPAPDFSLTVEGPFAGALEGTPPGDNLVLRAAEALKAHAASKGVDVGGAALSLEKELPVASGIGGGSADAAAALTALVSMWKLTIPQEELQAIGKTLGSDIPACIKGRPVIMRGIGDELERTPALPRAALVLVNPGVAMPTPPVYKAFAAAGTIAPRRPAPTGPWASGAELAAALAETANDLEVPAISLCPSIGDVLAALRVEGALIARMSGSGATCFAIFPNEMAAEDAAERLEAAHPTWWVMPTLLETL